MKMMEEELFVWLSLSLVIVNIIGKNECVGMCNDDYDWKKACETLILLLHND